MSEQKLRIEAFISEEGLSNWKPLPETSQYLTDKQLVPNVGDGLTLAGEDGKLIGLEKADIQHIQTVKRRWFNYASSDVALLLDYEAW